jgi:predicted GNAT superfamily acetyltransferase
VAVPREVRANGDADAMRRWRLTTRAVFTHYLGRGYTVTHFMRGQENAPPCYVLERR